MDSPNSLPALGECDCGNTAYYRMGPYRICGRCKDLDCGIKDKVEKRPMSCGSGRVGNVYAVRLDRNLFGINC